ncbi:MAG: F0F1 ATP synthase subunit A [Coprobacter sp.]|nr:F0F1 ATP synthase subunit A [Coprobacter sp.]
MKRCIGIWFLLLGLSFSAFASEEEKPFDAKETIFEHLLDNYGWEVPFSHSTRIPLPVIVRDVEGNWHLFSSARLEHGGRYNGFYIAEEGENKGKIESVDGDGNKYRPLDFSVTKNVFAILISALLVGICVLPLARFYRRNPYKAPRKWLGAIEFLVDMIYGSVIRPILGEDARRFAPYLLTLFFFIVSINLLGMIVIFPGGANLSGNISVTLVLAVCTFLVVNLTGTKHYWKELFWPEVPTWMKCPIPIMPVIEVFGAITKPVALMIRLFANMLGGHLIVLVLISLIFIFGAMGTAVVAGTTVLSVLFSIFMNLLHFLICFIQAYVFTMLSTIFISLSRAHGEESEK